MLTKEYTKVLFSECSVEDVNFRSREVLFPATIMFKRRHVSVIPTLSIQTYFSISSVSYGTSPIIAMTIFSDFGDLAMLVHNRVSSDTKTQLFLHLI